MPKIRKGPAVIRQENEEVDWDLVITEYYLARENMQIAGATYVNYENIELSTKSLIQKNTYFEILLI